MRKRWTVALAGLLMIVAALGMQGDARAAATGLTANVNLSVGGSYSSTVDLMTSQVSLAFPTKQVALTFGSGANQADRLFTATHSIAATEDLDVNAGSLTDAFGVTFTLVRLKVMIVCAAAANTGNIVLGGDTNSVPFLSAAATTVTLKPHACFYLSDPSAGGITVTPTTGDIIQVAPSAGTQVYDIVLIGASS